MAQQVGIFQFSADPREAGYRPGAQNLMQGKFINFSFNANDQLSFSASFSLSAIPELAKISAIISGILGIFGLLEGSAGAPIEMPKLVTAPGGLTLAALIGARNGIELLKNILQGQIKAIVAEVQRAIQSIKNLFACALKDPLLVLTLLSRILGRGWITFPPQLKLALQAIRDLISTTFTLTLIADIPMIDQLLAFLKMRIPPFLLLPFLPYIPGCGGGFYSGRPPQSPSYAISVDPQPSTGLGQFVGELNVPSSKLWIPVATPGNAVTLIDSGTVYNNGGYNLQDTSLFASAQLNPVSYTHLRAHETG
jgi:hypothetical protein